MSYSHPSVHELPSNLAVLVVDCKEFSKYDDMRQGQLVPVIQDVLEKASQRCGLPQLWSELCFPSTRGDGYQFGFDQKYLPYVVNRYPEALQAELYEINHQRLIRDGLRLRMRLGLHYGPVPAYDERQSDSPVGTIMNDTHRLVECDQLRSALEASDPDVTMLAAALSESVVNDVVRNGYSGRSEAEFVRVEATVKGKSFDAAAYLRVPSPSGQLLSRGLLGVQPVVDEEEPTEAQATAEALPSPQVGATAQAAQGESANNFNFSAGSGSTQGQNVAVGEGSMAVGGDLDVDERSEVVHGDKYEARGDVHGGRRWFGRDRGEKP